MRTCPDCKNSKPLDEYYNIKTGPGGKDTYCKACRKEKNKKYNSNNRERLNGYQNAWYHRNKERLKEIRDSKKV